MKKNTAHTAHRRNWFFVLASLLSLGLCHLSGCGPATPASDSSSFTDRQQAALKDPMGYKVPPSPDVSDDNMSGFDKPGFQRDVDHVINP